MIRLYTADCLDILKTLDTDSIDALVTDPPAAISFMNKEWDGDKGGREQWVAWLAERMHECLRVLKPGAHGLVWALPRTSHWTAWALEDAGFKIKDVVTHVFGSGFPKSYDISKGFDKDVGVERPVVGSYQLPNGQAWNLKQAIDENVTHVGGTFTASKTRSLDITAPVTELAQRYEGWGTALKPAAEHWILCYKPLVGRIIDNVRQYGTGGINIAACMIENEEVPGLDRWPANFMHDGDSEIVKQFPDVKGGTWNNTDGARHFNNAGKDTGYQTTGQDKTVSSAARFFYCTKANKKDKEAGCEGLPLRYGVGTMKGDADGSLLTGSGNPRDTTAHNHHPTVKSTRLMQWLVRLITPEGGTVIDPFMGSGSTGRACVREGFSFIGVDTDPEYVQLAEARIGEAHYEPLQETAKVKRGRGRPRKESVDKQLSLFDVDDS